MVNVSMPLTLATPHEHRRNCLRRLRLVDKRADDRVYSKGITKFARPEDAAWDPTNPNVLYLNTTNAFNLPSRLWKLTFENPADPNKGGTIEAVLDGSEGQSKRTTRRILSSWRAGSYSPCTSHLGASTAAEVQAQPRRPGPAGASRRVRER
jgi:secreted PhoX family phosphatase